MDNEGIRLRRINFNGRFAASLFIIVNYQFSIVN